MLKRIVPGLFVLLTTLNSFSQISDTGSYCMARYISICAGPGPSNDSANSLNDFIDGFYTTGGTINIYNDSSGCNGMTGNYINYCQHYLKASAGDTIHYFLKSGIIYPQSFAVFIDWDQNNTFSFPWDYSGFINTTPAATWTTNSFVVPPNTPNGIYRLRVRCAYGGASTIDPCNLLSWGETEDYSIYIGTSPSSNGTLSGTLSASSVSACSGSSVSLSVNHNGGPFSLVMWTGPGTYTNSNSSFTLQNIGANKSGTYHLLLQEGGCIVRDSINITVLPTPTITTNSGTVCPGLNYTISASGANTYTWFNGSNQNTVIVNPTVISSYTLTGANGPCRANKTAIVYVTPASSIIASPSLICEGETAILAASNATSYQWPSGPTTNTISVSPTTTTTYSVYTWGNACSFNAFYTLQVDPCTILPEHSITEPRAVVYPNPFSEKVHLDFSGNITFDIVNSLGQIQYKGKAIDDSELSTSHLAEGIYFLRLSNGQTFKIIKN